MSPYAGFLGPWAIGLFYGTLLVGAFRTTVGKRALNLYVLRSDGSRVSYLRAFVRELLRFSILLIISAFMVAIRSDKRGLHDLIADIIVLERR